MKTTIYLVNTDDVYSDENQYNDEVFLLHDEAIDYAQKSGGKLYEYNTDLTKEPSLYFEDNNVLNYEDSSLFESFKNRVKEANHA